jgi:hypothetical protein
VLRVQPGNQNQEQALVPTHQQSAGSEFTTPSAARWMDLWWWRSAFREYGSAWPLRSVLLGSFRQSRLAKGIGETLHPFRCRDIARDHPAHCEFRLQL